MFILIVRTGKRDSQLACPVLHGFLFLWGWPSRSLNAFELIIIHRYSTSYFLAINPQIVNTNKQNIECSSHSPASRHLTHWTYPKYWPLSFSKLPVDFSIHFKTYIDRHSRRAQASLHLPHEALVTSVDAALRL